VARRVGKATVVALQGYSDVWAIKRQFGIDVEQDVSPDAMASAQHSAVRC
jgi:hypothetical protein